MVTPPHIEDFQLGLHGTNCYIVSESDQPGARAWLVDVGYEPRAMLDRVNARGLSVEAVILTHAHLDHIGGLWEARRVLGDAVPILVHKAEAEFLTDAVLNLSALAGPPLEPFVGPEPDRLIVHGQRLTLGPLSFEVRHVPGHSPGNVALIWQAGEGSASGPVPVALVGDALFADSIGRTDFPTSDHATLLASIRDQLLTLPDATRVLSGHGPATTIGRERAANPFLQG